MKIKKQKFWAVWSKVGDERDLLAVDQQAFFNLYPLLSSAIKLSLFGIKASSDKYLTPSPLFFRVGVCQDLYKDPLKNVIHFGYAGCISQSHQILKYLPVETSDERIQDAVVSDSVTVCPGSGCLNASALSAQPSLTPQQFIHSNGASIFSTQDKIQ